MHGHVAGACEDHIVPRATVDRVVVVQCGIGRVDRGSENEIVAMVGVNDALRAVEELSAIRCQHRVREGGDHAMRRAGRMLAVEEGQFVGRELKPKLCGSAAKASVS